MTKRITFKGTDGSSLEGELALPLAGSKAPGVVVIQEWWGLNDHLRSMVDRFADAGFLAFAPDLYHGELPGRVDEASKLMTLLDKEKAVGEIGAAATFLESHERSNGRVAVVGFCLGGALAFASALHAPFISAVIPFYGLPQIRPDAFAGVKVPILAHFAKHDDWATAAVASEIQKVIEAGGGSMELHVYDAKHAFMRDTDPALYDAPSAKLAWARTLAFLETHLR